MSSARSSPSTTVKITTSTATRGEMDLGPVAWTECVLFVGERVALT